MRKLSSIFVHVYILLRINSYHAEINKIKNYFNVTKNKCVVISSGMVNVVNAADLFIEHTKTLNKIDLIQRSIDIHYLLRQEYKHVAAPCPTQEGMSYLYIVLITNVILRA